MSGWKILRDEARGRPRCMIVGSKGNEIVSVNPYREQWNETATAIVALPELLEACEDTVRFLERYADQDSNELRAKVAAAIRKAKGITE